MRIKGLKLSIRAYGNWFSMIDDDEVPKSLRQAPLEKQETSVLDKVRNALYDCIKSIPLTESPFFTQQENNHKRDLVQLMIKIDNKKIDSVEQFVEAMQPVTKKYSSEPFEKVINLINDILSAHANDNEVEADPTAPQFD